MSGPGPSVLGRGASSVRLTEALWLAKFFFPYAQKGPGRAGLDERYEPEIEPWCKQLRAGEMQTPCATARMREALFWPINGTSVVGGSVRSMLAFSWWCQEKKR